MITINLPLSKPEKKLPGLKYRRNPSPYSVSFFKGQVARRVFGCFDFFYALCYIMNRKAVVTYLKSESVLSMNCKYMLP